MRSYQIADYAAPLALAEGAAPTPTGTEVLLRIHACGVCHSDVHLWEGYFYLGGGRRIVSPPPDALPLTPGHEIVGEVVAVGPAAAGVAPGARRLVFPWIGCGTCPLCRAGDEHLCNRPQAPGVNRDGGYADHVLVPHPRYLLDFGGIDAALAATCACSGLTAYSALKKVGRLADGQSLLIIGAGGVGLAGVRLAKAVTGAAPIVADIDPDRRAAALEAGAAEAVDPSEQGAVKALVGRTGGVAAAIDFVGAESSAAFGDRALAKGGKLIVVGLFGGELRLSLPLLPMRAVTVCGSYVGSLAELAELLDLVRATALPPMPLAECPLAEATATLADLRAGRITGRVVLKP